MWCITVNAISALPDDMNVISGTWVTREWGKSLALQRHRGSAPPRAWRLDALYLEPCVNVVREVRHASW